MVLDYKDIDSDSDGCLDLKEAGFSDTDNDGLLDGTGVDSNGQVLGNDGYVAVLDSDSNSALDYKSGVNKVISVEPQDTTVVEGGTAEFSVEVTDALSLSYTWEHSTDAGLTWNVLVEVLFIKVNTPVLKVVGVTPAMASDNASVNY